MNASREEGRTFEESLLELERMVPSWRMAGSVWRMRARYEQGVGLIKSCYQQLRQAEQRIVMLAGIDEEQQPILQPFKHEATAPAKKRP